MLGSQGREIGVGLKRLDYGQRDAHSGQFADLEGAVAGVVRGGPGRGGGHFFGQGLASRDQRASAASNSSVYFNGHEHGPRGVAFAGPSRADASGIDGLLDNGAGKTDVIRRNAKPKQRKQRHMA